MGDQNNTVEKWVKTGLSGQNGPSLIQFAKQQGEFMGEKGLTKTQFRNVFNELRRIQQLFQEGGPTSVEAIRSLLKLKPKLAYLSSRFNTPGVNTFRKLIESGIDAMEHDFSKFGNLMDFAEALMGYHYAAEKTKD